MKNKKWIILGTLGVTTLVSAIVVPIIVLNGNNDNEKTKTNTKETTNNDENNKIIDKDVQTYVDQLNKLPKKIVKILDLDTITNKKAEILEKIKLLKNFPKLPTSMNLEVKEDSTRIIQNYEFNIKLIIKKDNEAKMEIEGFKVRSFTDQEIVEYYANKIKKILTNKVIKIDSINNSLYWQKSLIINKIKALDDFPTLPSYIKLKIELDLIENSNAYNRDANYDNDNFLEKPLSSEKLNLITLIVAKEKIISNSIEEIGTNKIKFFVQRKSSLGDLDNYFSRKENQKVFISSLDSPYSNSDLLTLFKNKIIEVLNPTEQVLNSISLVQGRHAPFINKQIVGVNFRYSGNYTKTINITFVQRQPYTEPIIDYFAQTGKKDLSIPGSTVISDKASLTTAIQEALKLDDSSLFDDTKKTYITVANDYDYSSFIKGIAKNVKVKIQEYSEEPEFVTLSITHLENNFENLESVKNYFEYSQNQKIFIPSSTSISSASDILLAVKNAIADNLNQAQKNLISIKNSQPTSLTKGQLTNVDFQITGGDDVTLSIFHNSSDFETTLKFFQKNPEYFIPSSNAISSTSDILIAVKDIIGDKLTQAQKALITANNESISLLKGERTYVSFSISNAKTILILVTQRSSEVQSIIDYFEPSKKQLSISANSISDEIRSPMTLIEAIHETLKTLNPTLFDKEKLSYITLHNDYEYLPFDNGITQNVKVIIQKDLETSEYITLSITYLQDSSSS